MSKLLGNVDTPDGLHATLTAERAIYHTYYEFFRITDTLQFERVGECFTRDAVIDYRTMRDTSLRFEGRESFVRYMIENTKARVQMQAHVMGQTMIEWHAGRPRLLGYGTAWHWFKANAAVGDLRPADWVTIGYVEDEFVQIDGEWLICKRCV